MKSKNYFELKKRIDNIIFLDELGDPIWSEFENKIINLLYFENEKIKKLNINTLEKIRFLMTILNNFQEFDFQNIPKSISDQIYSPRYSKWRKKSSYLKIFSKYIKNDKYFFPHHIDIAHIPNYKEWNLGIAFIDDVDILNSINDDKVEYFPLQVFQELNGNIKSLISLMPSKILNKSYKRFRVDNFEIINNFNIFSSQNMTKSSITPITCPFFDSYVQFFYEKENNIENPRFSKHTYEFSLDFNTRDKINDNNLDYLNSKIINEYNLRYNRQLSRFIYNYFQNDNKKIKRLFKTRATFPDFNSKNNYLLTIKKKKNLQFNTFLSFLKNWNYQTIVYDLKDKIILYGFFLPKFEISEEIIHIYELFDKYNINFKFEITNKDFNQSNLSIYSLPSSNQFSKKNLTWNLEKRKLKLSIKEKEEIIFSTLIQEKKIAQSLYE